jgi:hypothetical protein
MHSGGASPGGVSPRGSPTKNKNLEPLPSQLFPDADRCAECPAAGSSCVNEVLSEVRHKCESGGAPELFQRNPAEPREWYETTVETGATVFLYLFLLGEYDLAKRLIAALRRHKHARAARFLLATPYLSRDGKGPYDGENALHMVIAKQVPLNDPTNIVRWLCEECPPLVQGRATGPFFQPSHYLDERADDTCPWGEYPLSFAASLNLDEVVRYLVVEAGADMLAQDTRGFTALHAAVANKVGAPMLHLLRLLWVAQLRAAPRVEKQSDLFPALRWATPPPPKLGEGRRARVVTLDMVTNSDGDTPLMLAAKLDSKAGTAAFKALVNQPEFGRGESWRYVSLDAKPPLPQNKQTYEPLHPLNPTKTGARDVLGVPPRRARRRLGSCCGGRGGGAPLRALHARAHVPHGA